MAPGAALAGVGHAVPETVVGNAEIARRLGVDEAWIGFLSGLATAAAFVETGRARAALVVGADGLTRYLDPDDRGTAMLFGDGAGAVVLTATEPGAGIGPVALH